MPKKDKPPKDNPPEPKKRRNCGRPLGEHTIHELAQCQAAQN